MRYTVLTYIFGGYEKVHEVLRKDPEAEYLLITDDPDLKSSTWEVIYAHELEGLSVFDKCYKVRFFPFKYAHTDIVVRVDGSIGITSPMGEIVDAVISGDYDRCLMIHPSRNTMYDEYHAWVVMRRYPKEQATKCMNMMQRLGYDFDYKGLYQFGFEVVRNNRVNNELNTITYDLLKYLGDDDKIERVDQTVFSFVANALFSERLKVLPVSEAIITDGRWMQWYAHGTVNPLLRNLRMIKPYLFNRECKVRW